MAIRELGLQKLTTGFIDMRYEGHSSVSLLCLRDTEDRDRDRDTSEYNEC